MKITQLNTNPEAEFHIKRKDIFDDFLENRLVISTHSYIHIIEINNIKFLKAEGNYCLLFLDNNKSVLASKTLKYFKNILIKKPFIRAHSSYLVNLNKVIGIKRNGTCSIVLNSKTEIPVSRKYKDEILNQILKK